MVQKFVHVHVIEQYNKSQNNWLIRDKYQKFNVITSVGNSKSSIGLEQGCPNLETREATNVPPIEAKEPQWNYAGDILRVKQSKILIVNENSMIFQQEAFMKIR